MRNILNIYNNHGHFYLDELSTRSSCSRDNTSSRRPLHRRARPLRAATKHVDSISYDVVEILRLYVDKRRLAIVSVEAVHKDQRRTDATFLATEIGDCDIERHTELQNIFFVHVRHYRVRMQTQGNDVFKLLALKAATNCGDAAKGYFDVNSETRHTSMRLAQRQRESPRRHITAEVFCLRQTQLDIIVFSSAKQFNRILLLKDDILQANPRHNAAFCALFHCGGCCISG